MGQTQNDRFALKGNEQMGRTLNERFRSQKSTTADETAFKVDKITM